MLDDKDTDSEGIKGRVRLATMGGMLEMSNQD